MASQKLKRSALLHYIDCSAAAGKLSWFLIGKDVEDMSIELSSDVSTFTNILDETSVTDNGYTASTDVDTYYADPSDGAFYEFIKDIAMNRLMGDDCKTLILEVLVDKTEGPYDAWTEQVIVKPSSYGGATGGVRIPYTLTFCGNRTAGTATYTNTTGGRTVTFSDSGNSTVTTASE